MTDIEFEQVIIKALYANSELSSKVVPELDPQWFINIDHKYIVNAILDYNAKFSNMPNVIEMRRILTDDKTVTEFDKCMEIPDADVNTPYMLDEIQEFVRKRLLRQVQENISNYCVGGKSVGSFAEATAYAESFTFDTKVGFSFFEEPEVIYNDFIKNEVVLPTGCKTMDEMIHGGLHPQSMNIVLASTNIGKTLIMCSMASAMLLAGKKVLYITFEDPEVKIGQRIMQNLMDKSQNELKALNKEAYMRLFAKMLNQIGHNKLKIKEYPEYCVNALQVRALLKEYKEKHSFEPDVIMVDYLGCMIPDGRVDPNMNDNSRFRAITAQVRSIGMLLNIPIVSAMQSNRGGYGKAEIGLDDVADSYASTMKGDAIFGITQTAEMKAAQMYTVKLLKTRYGMPKCPVVTIGVDIEHQRIFDLKSFNDDEDVEIGSNNLPPPPASPSSSDVNGFTL